MGHIYIDGVLTHGTDPHRGWTDEDQERETDYGMRMQEDVRSNYGRVDNDHGTDNGTGSNASSGDSDLETDSIDALLARAAPYRIRLIQSFNRHDVLVWWADLYDPVAVSRRHGYGPSLAAALASALDATEVLHDVPTFHHQVATHREPTEPEFKLVRRV